MGRGTAAEICCTLVAFVAMSLVGCATTTDRTVATFYRPSLQLVGGAGLLHLTASGKRPPVDAPVKWVIGTVKNRSGETIGDVLSRFPPEDLVLDAFRQELARAGFAVERVDALPSGVAKGLDVSAITFELQEMSGVTKSEATAKLAVSLDIWKGGGRVKKLDYQVKFSDFAVVERARLLPEAVQNVLQGILEQAVPEVVQVLGKP